MCCFDRAIAERCCEAFGKSLMRCGVIRTPLCLRNHGSPDTSDSRSMTAVHRGGRPVRIERMLQMGCPNRTVARFTRIRCRSWRFRRSMCCISGTSLVRCWSQQPGRAKRTSPLSMWRKPIRSASCSLPIAKRILDASLKSYKRLLGQQYTYGMYRPGSDGSEYTCQFAMCSTIVRHLDAINPELFDYIVVDEAHRTGSAGYQKIMAYFRPSFYLGMTATPKHAI